MRQPYYHLSRRYLGREVVLEPRIPSGAAVGEERATPRVSVGMDVEDCLLAITWVKATGRTFYAYRLADDVEPVEPPRGAVPDVGDTRELWLLEPARFELVAEVHVPPQEPWAWPEEGPAFGELPVS